MKTEPPPRVIRFPPRILYLTEDTALVRRQLEARESLQWSSSRPRMASISTDEITPAWACYFHDQRLADFLYVGMRDGCVGPGQVRRLAPSVVVSGPSKGCGSSREAAPFAELAAGVRLVIADSFEKIYLQNALNIGLFASTDMSLVPRILAGEEISIDELTRDLDPVARDVVLMGGLAAYSAARLSRRTSATLACTAAARPMTLVEKIIARRVVRDDGSGEVGVAAVSPDMAVFVRADIRFSHEYVTAMASSIFRRGFGEDAVVAEPKSCLLFRDHLTFLDEVMPAHHREMGLLDAAEGLASEQRAFAERMGIKLLDEVEEGGSEAICHNAILEDFVLPGQVVIGTDSHTSTVGALGALGFGVGSTDMAVAWYTRDVRVRVPRTVRVTLHGSLMAGVTAKDVMLHILTLPPVAAGECVGKVIEFAGPGLATLCMDERATLANMAVEAGAFTGIMEADEVALEWLDRRSASSIKRGCAQAARMRGATSEHIGPVCEGGSAPRVGCFCQPGDGSSKLIGASRDRPGPVSLASTNELLSSDDGAVFAYEIEIDLSAIEPMVGMPGGARGAVPLARLEEIEGGRVKIDIAYGGSCTGGKKADMDMYAAVLAPAAMVNEKVASGVSLFIQFGSQKVRRYAEERGYFEIFEKVGATVLGPACGACIAAGPGVSFTPETVSVSAINRAYPGRSGPGRVYLASPLVVAASALRGYISVP